MDLIRLLRSLEEFLYELVGWLVFYPRTLWQIIVRPGEVAHYTRREFGKDAEYRFLDAISPVLMLILSVVLAHAVEMATRTTPLMVSGPIGQLLFGSEQGLLLTRSAAFCMFALGAALSTLWRQRLPINRETLRVPFSIQAFMACPFVLLLAVSQAVTATAGNEARIWAALIGLLAVIWYVWARTCTFVALNGGTRLAALGFVLSSFLATSIVIVALLLAIVL